MTSTGLANRREFERAVARLPVGRPFAFLAADIDGLKATNDTFGHAPGDELITAVGTAISSVVRRGDTVARVGGDEFAVLMLDASPETASRLGQRIQDAVGRTRVATGAARLSVGYCTAQAGDPEIVRRMVDGALYRAKHEGRARTIVRDVNDAAPLAVPAEAFQWSGRFGAPRVAP